MSRKRIHTGAPMVPRLLRGLLPKLDAGQRRDLQLLHLQMVDSIASGDANEATIWHGFRTCATWLYVARQLERGVPEMQTLLGVYQALLERYGRTGRVVFTGPELQQARTGVEVMEALADIVDLPTAAAASTWSQHLVDQLVAQHRRTAT